MLQVHAAQETEDDDLVILRSWLAKLKVREDTVMSREDRKRLKTSIKALSRAIDALESQVTA